MLVEILVDRLNKNWVGTFLDIMIQVDSQSINPSSISFRKIIYCLMDIIILHFYIKDPHRQISYD